MGSKLRYLAEHACFIVPGMLMLACMHARTCSCCYQVTPSLLGHYIAMGNHDDSNEKSDAFDPDIAAYCAFSFPAVAVTIGKERWGEVSALFHQLARDQQRKVRKPMAHSLHEVCNADVIILPI